jgi:hypothetical protein
VRDAVEQAQRNRLFAPLHQVTAHGEAHVVIVRAGSWSPLFSIAQCKELSDADI